MCSHFSFDLLRNAESVTLPWIRKGMAEVNGRSVRRTAISFFFIMLYYLWCVSLKKWGLCDQKNPNQRTKQAWDLIQELLGKIGKMEFSINDWSLTLVCTLICIHLRIPSVMIHTWPWLQQLGTNSSAPNLMVASKEQSRSHTCWCHRTLARCWAPHTHCTNPAHHWKYFALWGWVSPRSTVCSFNPSPVDEKKFWAAGALLNSLKGWSETVEQIALPHTWSRLSQVSCVFYFSLLFLDWNSEERDHSSSGNISLNFKCVGS